jgi:hypothetical protein
LPAASGRFVLAIDLAVILLTFMYDSWERDAQCSDHDQLVITLNIWFSPVSGVSCTI